MRPALDSSLLAVDIVVDNFNYGRFVGDAIESAVSQSHPRVRTIVVDDGSTDESLDVIRSFGDRIVPVLKQNGGQASALNAGFARCSGDVVIFLDADDVLAPEAASGVAATFADDPSLASVQYRMAVIDDAGDLTGVSKPAAHLPLIQGDVRLQAASFPFDLTWTAMSGNAFAARALRRIFPVPEADFRLGADWYTIHLARLLGPTASLDAVGAFYRVHGANSYERAGSSLDLDQVRQSIVLAERTRRHVEKLARELAIPLPHGGAHSVSALANRLVSLRLAPERHPLDDARLNLAVGGMRAARRRFDVAWPMRALFSAWFLAMAAAPRRFVRGLSEIFVLPERRARLNAVLASLHRPEERERQPRQGITA